MGPELGRYVAGQIALIAVIAFIAGAVAIVLGWSLVSFLASNISVTWG